MRHANGPGPGGGPFFVRAWQSLVFRSLNIFTHIGLGVALAFVYSLVATLMPGAFPRFVPQPGLPRRRLGASVGVLLRDAEATEILREVNALVVDRTGTLTEGKPTLVEVVPQPGQDEAGLLRLAASLEQGSEHPVASAIVALEPGDDGEHHAEPVLRVRP